MAVYVHATLTVKYGQLERFSEAMAKAVPIMADHGWKLIAGYQTIIGELTEVIDIWEVADANAVGEGMAAGASDPRFAEVGPVIAELVEKEGLQLVKKTS